MKTRIEFYGGMYAVFVNGEQVSAHATYGEAERELFCIIKLAG